MCFTTKRFELKIYSLKTIGKLRVLFTSINLPSVTIIKGIVGLNSKLHSLVVSNDVSASLDLELTSHTEMCTESLSSPTNNWLLNAVLEDESFDPNPLPCQ